MKTFNLIAVTILVLAATTAHADRSRGGNGFKQFFGALAQVAANKQDQYDDGYGYYEEEYDDGYGYEQAGYYQQGPVIFDVRGEWAMRSGKANRFQKTYDGMYVIPIGRGKGIHYIEIGENLYQDANSSGTYDIIDPDYAIWRSNDKRNLVIELFRQ